MPLKLRRFDFDHNRQRMTKSFTQTESFLDLLNSISPLSSEFRLRLLAEVVNHKFKKNHLLLQPYETARRLYYVEEGFLRTYFISESGKICTTWFLGKGDLVTSTSSFLTQQPSQEFIEVLNDCKLQSITYKQLNDYYSDFGEGNQIGRILIQKYYLLSEQRAMLMRIETPELRYKTAIHNLPTIEQLTSLTNLASYIGISRETLSRLRSKNAKH